MTAHQWWQCERALRWGRGLLLLYLMCQIFPTFLVYAPSASLRKGWYVRDPEARPLAVGDIVTLNTPPEVTVPAKAAGLLKQIAAIQGDQVCWDAEGMTVVTANGTASYPYHAEKRDLRRHSGCHAVEAGEMILVGTHPRSYDSRYFGGVDVALLRFRVRPLWTWEAQP